MFSRPLAFLLLALGLITAAAGGAYVATRHNSTDAVAATASAPAVPAATAPSTQPSTQPVAETEAAVSGTSRAPKGMKAEMAPAPAPRRPDAAVQKPAAVAPKAPVNAKNEPAVGRTVPMNGGAPAAQPQAEPQSAAVQPPPETTAVPPGSPKPAGEGGRPAEAQPEPPRVPQFEELILPASSVIGLQLETALSSERARLEDRVEARVSRDVMAAGRVAIPVGARVIGSVIEVDKGGKVKTPAHIGIRFHTLVLADGSEVALRTEPIYRDAESPAGNSAKKIGGAAVAGAILGGIMGGGKGAAIGAATGAGGGTAAVMSGDRSAVNIPSGSIVTAKLSSPATITVERRE
jgi:type IV secretory pathway VirB10-like protein